MIVNEAGYYVCVGRREERCHELSLINMKARIYASIIKTILKLEGN